MRGRGAAAAATALVALPVGALLWLARPGIRRHLDERLGALPAPKGPEPVWLHAASAGEVGAAGPLVGALAAAGHALHVSATSAVGRALWAERAPGHPRSLAPLDHPWCVDRALRRVRPRALVLVETELWPVWIAAVHRRGVPVVVLSGRLSDRSWPRYRRVRRWIAPTLGRLAAVGAAHEEDRERFRFLGVPEARLRVTGDLKLDPGHPPAPLDPRLEPVLAGAPCLVAGSTHPGEERAVVDAFTRIRAGGGRLRLVIAPRRLERLPALRRELAGRGLGVRLRSRAGTAPLAEDEVLLVDGMGELASLYRAADVSFVGGTLAPVGGHNLVEPLAAGAPVLHGPSVDRVRSLAERLAAVGAARSVADAAALGDALIDWIRAPEARRRAVRLGAALLEEHRGATERSLDLLHQVLAAVASGGS